LGVVHKGFMSVTVGAALGSMRICSISRNQIDTMFGLFCSHYDLLGEITDNVSQNTLIGVLVGNFY
jgi:hypothetical protein